MALRLSWVCRRSGRCGQDCRLHGPGNNVSEVCNLSSPHLCACHRDPAAPRLRRGKRCFSPRTWSGWIPVTSTGMRESNKPPRVSRISTDLRTRRAAVRFSVSLRWGGGRNKQRPLGEEVQRALLDLIGNREEECRQSVSGALGGGVRCPIDDWNIGRTPRILPGAAANGTYASDAWLRRRMITECRNNGQVDRYTKCAGISEGK